MYWVFPALAIVILSNPGIHSSPSDYNSILSKVKWAINKGFAFDGFAFDALVKENNESLYLHINFYRLKHFTKKDYNLLSLIFDLLNSSCKFWIYTKINLKMKIEDYFPDSL